MAVPKVEGLLAVGRLEAESVGKRVPYQIAHGCQRNTVLIVVDVGLHTCDIDGGGKASVAYGE